MPFCKNNNAELRFVKFIPNLLKFLRNMPLYLLSSLSVLFGVLIMYSLQTGCYFFSQEEVKRISAWFKEKFEGLKLFRLKTCQSV